jgi:glycolate oxidase
MRMPQPDQAAIDRRAEIAAALCRILPADSVIDGEDARRVYETDGLTAYRQLPLLVALPATTAEVSTILRYCHENKL